MDANERGHRRVRRRRPSLFWPLILIVLGVVFLFNNLGLMRGDLWDTILSLWPLIFIAIGLDGILRQEGTVGPTLMLGLGTVFLLGNFGYLPLGAWEMLLRLWPLVLIALGFDILIGRRSRLASFFGLILVLAILGVSLWMMTAGISGGAMAGRRIRQDLEGATQARIVIEPGAGDLRLKALQEPDALVMGTVPDEAAISVGQEYSLQDGKADYTLRSSGGAYTFPGSSNTFRWDLGLTPEIPIDLKVELGAGQALLDLTGLDLGDLTFGMGLGGATIVLPAEGRFDGDIEGAIGELVIYVPEDLGLRVGAETAMVIVQAPESYRKHGHFYDSPGYENAGHRVDLDVGLAIGRVSIREK